MSNPVKNRYEFALLFDVKDGNPNGDPDAGNLPRIDAETGQGIVTDVCLKRKVRNYVQMNSEQDVLIKSKELCGEEIFLNKVIGEKYQELGVDLDAETDIDGRKRKSKGIAQGTEIQNGRHAMCQQYFDVRTFGAVMSTGPNAGQVRGPVQITFGRSVDSIVALEHALTVCVARKEDEPFENQVGIQGRKNTVPYGLYIAKGFISAHLAAQTGFSDDDLELLWEALKNMFDHDRSAARGEMATRKLIVFKHDSALGNAPAHKLFDLVKAEKNCGDKPPRDFSDYTVEINRSAIPAGIELIEML